ncbi:hypothetical protein M8J75_014984 [Diaphorina citri]|nr:hypothetical protein M8J75_014984 [Diaphorina citri]
MAKDEKVAIVTGSNKGIGYGTVKGLCQKFDGIVYLTARDEKKGQAALQALKDEKVCKNNDNVRFHQLDVLNETSIHKLHDDIQTQHGGLDILVNNAGIIYRGNAPFGQQAETTLATNFFALVTVCHMLFPLLRPHARVVNVASQYGMLYKVPSQELKQTLLNDSLTEDQLVGMMHDYVKLAKEGKDQEAGWPDDPYTALCHL